MKTQQQVMDACTSMGIPFERDLAVVRQVVRERDACYDAMVSMWQAVERGDVQALADARKQVEETLLYCERGEQPGNQPPLPRWRRIR